LDLFPQEERDLVRQSLALAIKAIISQALLPCIMEGVARVPAVEVMLANPSVRKLIADGREADLPSVIRGAQREGMMDLTDSLVHLIQDGWVDPKDAYPVAPNTEELKMALKGIRTTAGGIL
jgi:twitching motility protein PilT